jgi:Outer membrane receptor proteins, mostly Fe transport
MKRKLAVAIAAMTAISAQALTGKVVDRQGRGIANARVEIVGGQISTTTDADGQFFFSLESADELHVSASGFSHRIIHLDGAREPVQIVMAASVIEQVDVIGLPLHASVIESSLPITVLSGDELRKRQAATLGDSLENEIGVHSSFHGAAASTPIIRGLSGPRVLIAQNGLDVGDVSRVGPDHAVASEVSTAQQVEILRGPATLFFGSGAIGGVVNVIDQRVPSDSETRGEWLLQHDSVNQQKLASFNVNSGGRNIALHLDGFLRDAEEYKVPVDPETGSRGKIANSGEESNGFTFGSSYLADDGYVGFSAGRLNREYGIPGHSHGEDEAEDVYADLRQNRYQLISEWNFDHNFLRSLNTRAAYTDYTHAEIEAGMVGTTFSNKTAELRLDLLHQDFRNWRGGLNLHYKESDVAADGAEAFAPPTQSRTAALAIMEERHFGGVLLQLGARLERVDITAHNLALPHFDAHTHGEDEPDHHEEEPSTQTVEGNREFTPASFSVGAVWDVKPGYNLGVALSRSQRAPSAAELMSFGPHIGAGTYEIGALFALNEIDGELAAHFNPAKLRLETANNIDLTFRKHEGDLGVILNMFYNKVDNFYYRQATGFFAEGGHEHDDDLHADEMPIYLFTSADVTLQGFEAQVMWQINTQFKAAVFSDYVRAELAGGEYLPRQSPRRFGVTLDYQWRDVTANLDATRYDRQNKVATGESTTAGYNMVDATITYNTRWLNNLAVYVKGENLTDTDARVHTSFLKDLAPKPGRNISIGVRGSF